MRSDIIWIKELNEENISKLPTFNEMLEFLFSDKSNLSFYVDIKNNKKNEDFF
jgi:hypothetical protein